MSTNDQMACPHISERLLRKLPNKDDVFGTNIDACIMPTTTNNKAEDLCSNLESHHTNRNEEEGKEEQHKEEQQEEASSPSQPTGSARATDRRIRESSGETPLQNLAKVAQVAASMENTDPTNQQGTAGTNTDANNNASQFFAPGAGQQPQPQQPQQQMMPAYPQQQQMMSAPFQAAGILGVATNLIS